jgi:GH24 family phage-related lysozyme (muramidase)
VNANTRQKPAPAKTAVAAAIIASLVFGGKSLMDALRVDEGRELTVYADKLAGGLPTVCMGLTKHVTVTPIIVGEKWSAEKCDMHEKAVAKVIQHDLVNCFQRVPPQRVFDAATRMAWNFGAPKVCSSQSMAEWNAGRWAVGCLYVAYTPAGAPNWSSAAGVFVPGLHNRRKREMSACLGMTQ